jgi:hypothetical protein
MRPPARRSLVVLAAAVIGLYACRQLVGIGDDPPTIAPAASAGDGAAGDAGAQDAQLLEGDASVCGPDGRCVPLPNGWTPVTYDEARSFADCPTGFAKEPDALSGPAAVPGACTCVCADADSGAPTCAGQIANSFGTGDCTMKAGQPFGSTQYVPGTCSREMHRGPVPMEYNNFVPPVPSGNCGGVGVQQPANVTFAVDAHVCAATTALCGTGRCVVSIGPAVHACITEPGDVACPVAFAGGLRVVAGTGPDYSCGPCACAPAPACNGSISIYTDDACSVLLGTYAADGSCLSQAGGMWESFRYVPDPQCRPPPVHPAISQVGLLEKRTFCCMN